MAQVDRMLNRLVGACLFAAMMQWVSLVHAWQGPSDQHAKLALVSEQDALVPGKTLLVGIRFDLQDGWHTYWSNPGDSGEPPRVEWQLPPGFRAGEIQWPYPERVPVPPFMDYGYANKVLLTVPLTVPSKLMDGESATLAAQVHYLVCREVCIPGKKQLELSLPVRSSSAASGAKEQFEGAQRKLPKPVPRNWKISAASAGDEFVLTLKPGHSMQPPQFFPIEEEQIENAAPQKVKAITGGVRLHLKKSKHLTKPLTRLRGVVVTGVEKAYVIDVAVSQSPREGSM